MPTNKLGLPTIAGNINADVVRDLNALAQSVDDKAGAPDGLARLGPDGKLLPGQENTQQISDASTTQKGIVQLDDSTDSTSTTKAATPNAVKKVKELIYGIATTAEAKAGTVNNKYMTPLRMAEAIPSLVPKNVANGYAGVGPDGKLHPNIISGALETIAEIDISLNPAANLKVEGLQNFDLIEVSVLSAEHNHTSTSIISVVIGNYANSDFSGFSVAGSTISGVTVSADYRVNTSPRPNNALIKFTIKNTEQLSTEGVFAHFDGNNAVSGLTTFVKTFLRLKGQKASFITLLNSNGQLVSGKLIVKGVRG